MKHTIKREEDNKRYRIASALESQDDTTKSLSSSITDAIMKAFDPRLHPRHPKGRPEGGQFRGRTGYALAHGKKSHIYQLRLEGDLGNPKRSASGSRTARSYSSSAKRTA